MNEITNDTTTGRNMYKLAEYIALLFHLKIEKSAENSINIKLSDYNQILVSEGGVQIIGKWTKEEIKAIEQLFDVSHDGSQFSTNGTW